MDKITLYSTGCPKCQVLEKKLMKKQLEFDVCEDISYMKQQGWMQAPMLVVGDKVMDFHAAVEWINSEVSE